MALVMKTFEAAVALGKPPPKRMKRLKKASNSRFNKLKIRICHESKTPNCSRTRGIE